ncbi:hypothetical protein HK096_003346 [Nowakowskiella sp. JEL0078]|nr:hypothetical protein HK096_003346 [Nowakowskiella sp. JEL0078]
MQSLSGLGLINQSITHVFVDARNRGEGPSINKLTAVNSDSNRSNSGISRIGRTSTLANLRHAISSDSLDSIMELSEIDRQSISSSHYVQSSENSQPKFFSRVEIEPPIPEVKKIAANSPNSKLINVNVPYLNIQRTDEIILNKEDLVKVEITFQDGWAFGVNLTTGLRGYFPMNSFDSLQTESDVKLKLRVDQDTKIPESPRIVSFGFFPPANLPARLTLTSEEGSVVTAGILTPPKSDLLAVLPCVAIRDDELTLYPGDRVLLEMAYNDGWGFGRIADKIGYFPLSSCIVLKQKM